MAQVIQAGTFLYPEQWSVHPYWLGYFFGDEIYTQLYRDYFINHDKDPKKKQPVFHGSCHKGQKLLLLWRSPTNFEFGSLFKGILATPPKATPPQE